MKLWAILRVALRALDRNKMRSLLTMLGIVIGVGAVITMVSLGQGAQNLVQEQIQSMGTNILQVWAGSRSGSRNAASGRRCRRCNRTPGEDQANGKGKGWKIRGSLPQGGDAVEDPVRLNTAFPQNGLAVFPGADQPPLQSRPLGPLNVGPEVVPYHHR